MAKQTINIGSAELAGDGESIRSAFNKVNSNFTELYERDLNTDSQTLTLVDDTLTITGGNSVNLDQYSKFSGAYTDLTDLPSLVTSYNQLTDLPSIPADIGDLTDTGNLLSPGPASELVGVTVAAVGGTASANETGITYSNKIAIFTVGAFTVGEWTDVQIGWTVTDNNGFTDTIASRGGFGAASFVTTVNNWPAPASGKTYVFTSPDYQPASVNPVEITVGNNDWLFNNNGSVTFPDATVQNTAYTGTAENIESENSVSININLSDSTTRTWHFGEDGNLQAPGIVSAPNVNATSSFGLPVYATEAARDSAITSPQPGMMVYVSSGEGQGLQVRGATQWNPVGGLTGV